MSQMATSMACNCRGGETCCMRVGRAAVVAETRPYSCPVCRGTGRMMPQFPLPPTVECRPCEGRGVIWR